MTFFLTHVSSNRLKPLDIEFMKQLHEKVNIVPVIGKADTLTPEECAEFKANVMKEIENNDIKIYQFPVDEFDEEEEAQDLQVSLGIATSILYNDSNLSDVHQHSAIPIS